MPIDFHAGFWINNPDKIIQPRAINRPMINSQPAKDTFEKQVQISTQNIDKAYDGIKIEKKSFGKIKKTGENATLYTITNKNGASVDLSSFGAGIISIKIPDKNGKMTDVTQGYTSVTPYEEAPIGHAGGTIGPCANKIDNGTFKLNGIEYKLECNKDNGKTHSHGGSDGFDTKNWKAEILKDGVKFNYTKKDMEGGYPAEVKASVTYKFDNDNRLHIIYQAESDNDTILNLTNHSYFNLDGAENTQEGSVKNHLVKLPNSTKYTVVNDIAIPTGEIAPVENTRFDFREYKKLSEMNPSGYDQNYCIDGYDGKKMIKAAEIKSEKTGIKMEVSTNLPGFQFYTANNLGKSSQPAGKDGKRYEKHSSFCVEPQFYPNAINTFDEKPVLKKGETFNREIIYSFKVENSI